MPISTTLRIINIPCRGGRVQLQWKINGIYKICITQYIVSYEEDARKMYTISGEKKKKGFPIFVIILFFSEHFTWLSSQWQLADSYILWLKSLIYQKNYGIAINSIITLYIHHSENFLAQRIIKLISCSPQWMEAGLFTQTDICILWLHKNLQIFP